MSVRKNQEARATALPLSVVDFAREAVAERCAIGFSRRGEGALELLFHRSTAPSDEKRLMATFDAHENAIAAICDSLEIYAGLARPGSIGFEAYIEPDDDHAVTKAPKRRATPSNESFIALAETIYRREIAIGLRELHGEREAMFEVVTHDDDPEVEPGEPKFWLAFEPHAETVVRLHICCVRYHAIRSFTNGGAA